VYLTENRSLFIEKNFKFPGKLGWNSAFLIFTLPFLIVQEFQPDFKTEFKNIIDLWCDFENLSRYQTKCYLEFHGGLLSEKKIMTNGHLLIRK